VWAIEGATGDGGSGNDLVGGIGANTVLGGSGSDEVVIFGATSRVDCRPNGDVERRCENYGIQ